MTIRRDPSTLHGTLEAAIQEAGSYAAAADIMGVSEKWLRNASNPTGDPEKTGKVTYAHARTMSRVGVEAFARDLAGLLGMTLVPLEAADATAGEVMVKAADIMREAGGTVAAFAEAAADGTITPAERAALLRRTIDLEREIATAKRLLGSGG